MNATSPSFHLSPIAPLDTRPKASAPQSPIEVNAKHSRYEGPDRPANFKYQSSNSKLSPDQDPHEKNIKKYINTDVLRHDKHVKIYQEIAYVSHMGKPVGSNSNEFVIETSDRADKVTIKKGPGHSLIATINNQPYQLNLLTSPDGSESQPLRIRTRGDDDCVLIDPAVKNTIRIELGDGNDYARAGAGDTRLYGGAGNDRLQLGSGSGIAFGNEGDDLLIAGTGTGVLKGNNGNDRLQVGKGASDRRLFMDGGDGHDFMIVTRNDSSIPTIMHGGKGDNLIVANGPATIYTGRDKNIVRSDNDDTVIYAKPSDEVHRTRGSVLVHTQPNEAGKTGYVIEGSAEFVQNVEDDMELLRMSRQGQKMLGTADAAAKRSDSPVRITELTEDNGAYHYSNQAVRQHLAVGHSPAALAPAAQGYISQQQPGAIATDAQIQYNPSFSLDKDSAPVNVLYHEMAHAYNGASGTFLQGHTRISKPPAMEPNNERQAVGLPTDTLPFSFEDQPASAPNTTNPKPFTENGLREEMRRPLRKSYT